MTPEEKRNLEKAHFAYRNLFVDYWDLPSNSVCEELEGLTREEESIFASSIPPPIWPINPNSPPKPPGWKPIPLGTFRGIPRCIIKFHPTHAENLADPRNKEFLKYIPCPRKSKKVQAITPCSCDHSV